MLQQACNRLILVCNQLATGSIEPVIGLFLSGSIEPVASRLQMKTSQLQADYRLDRACCKPIADENKPVAGRLQTKTGSIEPATGSM